RRCDHPSAASPPGACSRGGAGDLAPPAAAGLPAAVPLLPHQYRLRRSGGLGRHGRVRDLGHPARGLNAASNTASTAGTTAATPPAAPLAIQLTPSGSSRATGCIRVPGIRARLGGRIGELVG